MLVEKMLRNKNNKIENIKSKQLKNINQSQLILFAIMMWPTKMKKTNKNPNRKTKPHRNEQLI